MTVAIKERLLIPQPGPQSEGSASEADILIMGGAAGGGIGGEPKIICFWDGEMTDRNLHIC